MTQKRIVILSLTLVKNFNNKKEINKMFNKRDFKPVEKSEYTEQARKFLEKNEIIIEKQPFKFVKNENLKNSFNLVYHVQIIRHYLDNAKNINLNNRGFSLEFTDSVSNSEKMIWLDNYSILACLTKSDPGSFKNFCDETGCDTDSISHEKIYRAVCEEWEKVSGFFSKEEILELQEII
jgi:hypothetical protein